MDRKRKARLTSSLIVEDDTEILVEQEAMAQFQNRAERPDVPSRRRARGGTVVFFVIAVLFLVATAAFTHFYHISLLHLPTFHTSPVSLSCARAFP